MKKQRFKANFLHFDLQTYETLRDCYLDHSAMLKLRQDPVEFLINFQYYTRKVPAEEFRAEIKKIAKKLFKEYQANLAKVA